MNDLRIRSMRPDEISIASDWAAAEGWNPGLADAACFSTVDQDGFLIAVLDGTPAATIRTLPVNSCARAWRVEAATTPPRSPINSRRLIASPEAQDKVSYPRNLAL